jgi:hypothetical protein
MNWCGIEIIFFLDFHMVGLQAYTDISDEHDVSMYE